MRIILAAALVAGYGAAAPALSAPIAKGSSEQAMPLGDRIMPVFTYRPDCADLSLLLVFHGQNRNAAGYRSSARPIADRLCMIVVAPLFDRQHFPSWRYQRGGIVHRDKVRDPRRWTGNIVDELAAWVRRQEGRALPYFLIGHSAGGQFLSRVAAFVPTEARRIVIANPSTYVAPSLDVEAPYGMGGVYPQPQAEAELRRYLDQPVTIFLGTADVGSKARNDSAPARAQGDTRLDRGLHVYRAGEKLASARGWTFRWRLTEAPGVGHSAGKMFSAPQAIAALAP
jgi:pimeloyl-ACP methyl ester carboxylesterase